VNENVTEMSLALLEEVKSTNIITVKKI